jgi:hypothetical protein
VDREENPFELPASTFTDFETSREGVRSLWLRRAFLVLLLLVVLAGLVGLAGVRSTTSTHTELGWTLTLEHASIARAGLDVPWEVRVRRQGGFDGPVTLAVTGEYLDIFETQAFHPEPAASRRDAQLLYLEFDPPPAGEELVVAYDAYIQPASQLGAEGSVSVIDGGVPRATVEFGTTLWP